MTEMIFRHYGYDDSGEENANDDHLTVKFRNCFYWIYIFQEFCLAKLYEHL